MSSTKPLPPSPPPLPPSTRKRLVSSTPDNGFFMDPEVIEIPPPVPRSFKSNKKKQVVIHEVIDVDKDEDSSDVVILDERVNVRNKGKAVKGSSGVYSAFHTEDFLGKSTGSINKVEPSMHSTQGSHNIYNLDCDLAYEDDLSNYYLTDCMDVDEYAMLQAHFDSVDLPAGVEAEIPWFPNFSDGKKNASQANTQSSVNGNDQYLSPWLSEPAHMSKKPASVSSSSFQTSVDLSLGGAVHSTFLYPQGSQSQELAPSQHKLNSHNPPLWSSFYQAGGSTNGSNGSHSDSTMLPQAVNPTYWDHFSFGSKKQTGAGSLMHSNIPPPIDTLYHAMVAEPSMTWLPSSSMTPKYNYNKHNLYPSFPDPVDGACITPQEVADIRKQRDVNEEDILSKFQHFKKFDTVEDFSDHHYASSGSSTKHAQKNWAKKIQEEWRMLEKDLPDTIFVRVYESRMDLLRAVIIGAEGTPYHDGLFFFDVLFPAGYPKVPPQVYYHSGGLRLNPNLYNCGKVCLSLLNTWSGSKNEKWIPGMSTMLQVLVSIQALILNQDPYFNEPGWAHHKGSPQGERLSQQYNEDIFLLSLKTMAYSMRRPPKHFEDFVVGHFYQRAHDILSACKAYMNGSQVGCLVKGGLQNVNEGDKSCSHKFKDSAALAGHVSVLVKEFTKLGAKDCEKFLTVPQCPNNRVDNTRRGVAIS